MADEQVINQLKERVAFLETLVMSLVAKNQPSTEAMVTQANTNPANNVQATSTIADETSEEQVPLLMRLPPEIRADILERVLQPAFEGDHYGLTPPSILPVTMHASFTRIPASLHVNQIIRSETTRIYLGLVRTKTVELELDNKRVYDENEALVKHLEDNRGFSPKYWARDDWTLDKKLRAPINKLVDNFKAMAKLDASRRALLGDFSPRCERPHPW
jgi:hypothetical protein